VEKSDELYSGVEKDEEAIQVFFFEVSQERKLKFS